MKINKKSLLTFGAVLAISAPVVAVVSCASHEGYLSYTFKKEKGKPAIKMTTNSFDGFDFKNFGSPSFKSEPVMFRSAFYSALSQGMSYLFNIVRELGFNWNEHGIKSEYLDPKNKPDISIANGTLYKDPKSFHDTKVIENMSGLGKMIKEANDFTGGVSTYMKSWMNYYPSEYNKELSSIAWNYVTLVNVSDPNFINPDKDQYGTRDSDPLTQKSKFIPGYSKMSPVDKKIAVFRALNDMEVFNKKATVYDMFGLITRKVAVELYPSTQTDKSGKKIHGYKLVSWHFSDGFHKRTRDGRDRDIAKFGLEITKKMQDSIPKPESEDDPVRVQGSTWLDPLSEDGVMPDEALETLSLWYDRRKLTGAKDDKNSFISEGRFSDGVNHDRDVQIYRYSSFIDGEKPGTLLFQMFANNYGENKYQIDTYNVKPTSKDKPFALPMVRTPDHFYQTFYTVTNEDKIKELVELTYYTMKNMTTQMETLKKTAKFQLLLLEHFASPIFVAIKNYVHDSGILEGNKKEVKEKIRKAFNKINNGSHYMLSVEIFMRGLKNIPPAFRPRSYTVHNTKDIFEIVGMADTTSIYQSILHYAANITTRESAEDDGDDINLFKCNGHIALRSTIPFNPRKPSVDDSIRVYRSRAWSISKKDILDMPDNPNHQVMHGKELPVYGGRAPRIKLQTGTSGKLDDLK